MTDKTQNPAEIYLVPVFDGDHDHVWCDTPAPGEGMREEDATRYVREDIYLALQAQVEQLRNDLTEATDILESQLLPTLDDTYPLFEMIKSFRYSICTKLNQKIAENINCVAEDFLASSFVVAAHCHPSRHPSFKHGIWYGCIDGREITAPRHDKNAAINDARAMLYGSGYLAHLQTHCESLGRRKTLNEKETLELASLRAALEKYERFANQLRQQAKAGE